MRDNGRRESRPVEPFADGIGSPAGGVAYKLKIKSHRRYSNGPLVVAIASPRSNA